MSLIKQTFRIYNISKLKWTLQTRNFSDAASLYYDRDPSSLFLDAETQNILKSITQFQLSKVFRKTAVEDNRIQYKFMTTEDLEEKLDEMVEIAQRRLQMPPIVKIAEDKPMVLSNDTALKGFSDTNFIITDITYGLNPTTRKVVVRHTNGNLEYTAMNIAKRMNQIYFPLNGRQLRVPLIFSPEHLENCLNNKNYEHVLDRLLLQFEPYEKEFHDISSKVYLRINKNGDFHDLRSTRHFGPMSFFLAWHRCIDDLLYDMVKRNFLINGVELIILMYKLNDIPMDYVNILQKINENKKPWKIEIDELRESSQSHDIIEEKRVSMKSNYISNDEIDELCINFIDDYINKHALKKVQLELALNSLKEIKQNAIRT